MRSSETVLGMLQERGKQGLPIHDLYRQLYNPHLYLRAYARLYSNTNELRRVVLEGNTVGEPDDARSITSGSEEGDRRRAARQ